MEVIRCAYMSERIESLNLKVKAQQLISRFRVAYGTQVHRMDKTIGLGVVERMFLRFESHFLIILMSSGHICHQDVLIEEDHGTVYCIRHTEKVVLYTWENLSY